MKQLLQLLEGGKHTGWVFYHLDNNNQTIAFIFDFQVKREFQSWLQSFWTEFRRNAIFHMQHDFFYDVMGELVGHRA